MRMRLTAAVSMAMAIALAVGVGACSSNATWNAPGETRDPPKVNIESPADGSADVPTSAELVFKLEGTQTAEVTMTAADGAAVGGAMRDDGSSWVPAEQLAWSSQYTATIKATKSDGSSAEAKTTFTTMDKPGQLVRVQSYNGDHVTYGVGMPIIVRFDTDVPERGRAGIQRRLFVTSNPPQEGVWHWISSPYHNPGSGVHYRPKDYWQPGTKIDVRIAPLRRCAVGLRGVWRQRPDHRFTIGESMIMSVDNATKQMTVTQNGQVTKTSRSALGKPSTPS
jgi:hypothetical protein